MLKEIILMAVMLLCLAGIAGSFAVLEKMGARQSETAKIVMESANETY